MTAAACQNCEFRADEFGQQDNCDGTGLIAYAPGNYGRECRECEL